MKKVRNEYRKTERLIDLDMCDGQIRTHKIKGEPDAIMMKIMITETDDFEHAVTLVMSQERAKEIKKLLKEALKLAKKK